MFMEDFSKEIIKAANACGFSGSLPFDAPEYSSLLRACGGDRELAIAALNAQMLKHYKRSLWRAEEYWSQFSAVDRWRRLKFAYGGSGQYARRLFKHPRTGKWWLCRIVLGLSDDDATQMAISDRVAEYLNRYLDA